MISWFQLENLSRFCNTSVELVQSIVTDCNKVRYNIQITFQYQIKKRVSYRNLSEHERRLYAHPAIALATKYPAEYQLYSTNEQAHGHTETLLYKTM